MIIIWFIGFLFTIGVCVASDEGELKWYEYVAACAICFVVWPYYLGFAIGGGNAPR